jgi:DNA-binding NarL/FixJ family response regulator
LTQQAKLSGEAAMAKTTTHNEGGWRLGIVCADPLRVLGLEAILGDRPDIKLVPLSGVGELHGASLSSVVIDAGSTDHLFELLETFWRARPDLKLIVIGMEEDHAYIQKVIGAGAKGYLSQTATEAEIRMAIDIVQDGSVWAPRKVLAKLLVNTNRVRSATVVQAVETKITGREAEVLQLLIQGQPNRVIAKSMGIDQATVKAHVGRLMRKMGVTNRISLSVQAVNEYLVEK